MRIWWALITALEPLARMRERLVYEVNPLSASTTSLAPNKLRKLLRMRLSLLLRLVSAHLSKVPLARQKQATTFITGKPQPCFCVEG